MMIRLQSKKLEPILSYSGKLMASSVDASKEARAWVERHNGQLDKVKNVIVLGVGCGYHLVALQEKHPEIKIVAIDFIQELIDFASTQHSLALADVKFVCAKSHEDLGKSRAINDAVKDFYTVLSFSPAQISNEIFYRTAQEFLLARTLNGFKFLLLNRPEIRHQFNVAGLVEHSDRLLSIKTLDEYCGPDEQGKAKLLIKALRELVV